MEEEKTIVEKKVEKVTPNKSEFAVIRLRGGIGVKKPIKDTLLMLNLNKTHHCVIINNSPEKLGMILKCKDYVTWGEITPETKKLLEPRKEENKKAFRLNPPKGGFERKGIKKAFREGGALGYRKDKINGLIKRML